MKSQRVGYDWVTNTSLHSLTNLIGPESLLCLHVSCSHFKTTSIPREETSERKREPRGPQGSPAAEGQRLCLPTWETRAQSLSSGDPLGKKWQTRILAGEVHAQRSLAGPWGCKESDVPQWLNNSKRGLQDCFSKGTDFWDHCSCALVLELGWVNLFHQTSVYLVAIMSGTKQGTRPQPWRRQLPCHQKTEGPVRDSFTHSFIHGAQFIECLLCAWHCSRD